MKTCPTCQTSYPNNYAVCPADGTTLVEIGTWADGSVIRGKYKLLAKVGQGGMGAVYKALHLAFDEMRALKVISPELLSDELFVKRFKHEAVITRRLQHPNAVRVDDIDEAEDGRPYIVMEFIDGKSLKKLIREEGPLPYARVCAIIKQAASALEAAHKLGMVHRDIKPDNIALVESTDGEMVKVLDFGIAKVKEARMGDNANLTLTGAGVVIGTPQYMSPEQAMGKRGDELDGRADLYSLGVVMYQMLTADLPFKADTTMEMLLAHMQKPPAPIAMMHPELQVPEALADLTMRLLEKNRDLRPASGRALIQEIERIEKDLSTPGRTRVLTADDLVVGDHRGAAPTRVTPAVVPPPRPTPPTIRPPEPPKPAPQPPVRQQPVQVIAAPLPRSKPAESRWGMWVALVVLLVGLGGGGLYLATRGTTPQPQPEPAPSPSPAPNPGPSSSPNPVPTPVVNPEPTPPTPTPPPKPNPDNGRHGNKTRIAKTQAPQPPPEPTPPAIDPRAIKSALTLGKFHFDRGEYSEAIAAYEGGLHLDPSNAELRQKLQEVVAACKRENAILGETHKCGE
jgi:eukaryotic-like serine/threonine-protein kinase